MLVEVAGLAIFDVIRGGSQRARLLGVVLPFALTVISLMIFLAGAVLADRGLRDGAQRLAPVLTWFGYVWLPLAVAFAWWSNLWRGFNPWSLRFVFTLCLPGIVALLTAALIRQNLPCTRC